VTPTADDTPGPAGREDRVNGVIAEYLRAAQAGAAPDRAALLAAHPDLAVELTEFLADLDCFASAAGPLRELGRETPDPRRPEADTPTGDFPPPGPDAGPPAGFDRLGDLAEVARGGMGVVYRGRDPALDRDLAVKVLREDHAGEPRLVRRFLAEARIMARLQHPGIPPLHAAGTLPDGRPYFTMKLIRGRTLAELLDGRPGPGHDLPRWLQAFEQVCQAVAYAHSEGVVHRDLKPLNVMVGAFGEVQVMDWGLAKALPGGRATAEEPIPDGNDGAAAADAGREELSRAGAALGTLAYMPPEQARGEIDRMDERTDVFALGAILCELLTDHPPYRGTRAEMLTRARQGDLGEAFTRLDGCGADAELVALAQRCLAAERDDRPGDGGAVAGAVAAYLAGVQERLRQADRERAAAEARAEEAKATAKAERERAAAEARAEEAKATAKAERERAAAEARAEEAKATAKAERRAKRRAVGLAAAGVLLLAGAGSAAWWYQQGRAARDAAVGAMLPPLASAQDGGRWLEAKTILEQAERRLGDGGPEELRGRLRQARADLELAEALEDARLRETEVRDWNFDWRAKTAAYAAAFARYGLTEDLSAEELAARVRGSAVRDALVATLDGWSSLPPVGRAEKERLRKAAELADPDGWRAEVRRAQAAGDRAELEKLAADPGADAQPAASLVLLALALGSGRGDPAAAALLRRARSAHPSDFWAHHNLGACLAHATPPAAAEAEAGYRAAVALRPQSAGARYNLGLLLSGQPGRAAEAEAEYRAVLRQQPDYPDAHNGLGNLLMEQPGRAAEAEQECRTALTLRPDFSPAHYNLGTLLLKQPGRGAEAEKAFRDAIKHRPDFPEAHLNLGLLLERQPGRAAEAEDEYRVAIRLKYDYPGAHNNLGNLLSGQPGRAAEAEAELRTAIRLKYDYPGAHYNLGTLLLKQPGRAAEAEEQFRLAIISRPDFTEAHNNLGNLLSGQPGRAAEAEAELRTAIRLKYDYPGTHYSLGNLLAGQPGRAAEAEKAFRDAIKHRPDFPEAHCNLGLLLQRSGRFAGSLAELRRGHELGSRRPDWHKKYPSGDWVRRAERLAALEARLPALLRGDDHPAPADLPDLMEVCRAKQQRAAATRLAADALAADPRLGHNPASAFRYDAACCAALAAAGQGEDAARLPAKARVSLRRQALGWLRADLTAWGRQADDPKARPAALQTLRHWPQDPDLAGVRDPAELGQLPEAERAQWQRLWADAADLLRRAGSAR
jgi:serine/threonine-protein kinase